MTGDAPGRFASATALAIASPRPSLARITPSASRTWTVGKRGESIATAARLDFCGHPTPFFDPHFLGEKGPTYDLLVELVNAGSSPPYFFAQVKATTMGFAPGTLNLRVALQAVDVRRMVLCPIPTYLTGVDEPASQTYIVSIHGHLKGRIASIPSTYRLDGPNLKILYDEVRAYWATFSNAVGTKTSAFTI